MVCRARRASRRTGRDTSRVRQSSASEGSLSPMAYSPRSMAPRRWVRTASIALTRRGPRPPVWLSDRFTGVILRVARGRCQDERKQKIQAAGALKDNFPPPEGLSPRALPRAGGHHAEPLDTAQSGWPPTGAGGHCSARWPLLSSGWPLLNAGRALTRTGGHRSARWTLLSAVGPAQNRWVLLGSGGRCPEPVAAGQRGGPCSTPLAADQNQWAPPRTG